MKQLSSYLTCPGARKGDATVSILPVKAFSNPGIFFVLEALALLHGLTVNQPQAGVNDGREWRDNQPMGERLLAGWRTGGPGSETSSDSKHYSGGSCNTLEKP